ncbi:uncharacterized protein PADG_01186 [Paracoccidioides brasiliensis Pb18]|uniref:ATP synthase mitochondrial F1 complex assembly factor 1 n=1 Tax=Paracoccidioides brasiliensis (strain Pb18) TaxID=502780 RepID=C1FZG0_PARBD|nr:uncharacterized protein PADG_01186 [Paracoccidioides brasiliensis Pb18]EEH44897.2 hypothetical protein PADG_01186 [Paracoccidioides brasiliensis Pb18]
MRHPAHIVSMAPIRTPAVRSIATSRRPPFGNAQRRWARVRDVRLLTTHQDPNRVLDKYKDKLDRKAKEEGYSSISALRHAYQDNIKNLRTRADFNIPPIPGALPTANGGSAARSLVTSQSPKPPTNPPTPRSQMPGIKPLSSYIDIPKILTLPAKEIETVWRLRHAANPQSVCATISLDTYKRMVGIARQNPQFVLPLPRKAAGSWPDDVKGGAASGPVRSAGTGADIHFLQWAFHPPAGAITSTPNVANTVTTTTLNTHTSTVLFTHLASYKLHGAYSQPHTIITHYLDLAETKGLVLMSGAVVSDRGVAMDEAKLLVMWLQWFYDWGVDGAQAGKRAELVRMFNQGDVNGFKLEDLMDEVERV